MPISRSILEQKDFLSLGFDQLTFADAVNWLRERRETDNFRYIVTPNVDHIVRIESAPDQFASLYTSASLRLCDSRILSALARLVGITLPVVPGSDLVVALFESVLESGDKIAIIGGKPSMIVKLHDRYPELAISHIDAPMGLRTNTAARASIASELSIVEARFVLIAIGSPQQEMLAYEMLGSAGMRGTALCIGASIEFIVGNQMRAPRALQRMGMEWAWRLASNPRRLWRRYLVEGPRIFLIFYRWWSDNRPKSKPG